MNKIWVVVWPLDKTFNDDEIFEIIKACNRHFEDGGRFVAVWLTVLEKNIEIWEKMSKIWMMLEQAIGNRAGAEQFSKASDTKIENGRVSCEAGSPEIAISFYGNDSTVACAKILYETIRKKILDFVPLPCIKKQEFQLMRTSAGEGGDMWRRGRPKDLVDQSPVKSCDLGGKF
ncbi:unnamed protein product [Heligmosomoides polygyrus]|uniref:TIR domain-containing protein n=1 Tax=Heligmosomoides polygyrus TaxID=6339 RepID=A0A183GPR7_HELPZ|nr:unnamed protein product [Heligmosomoides polygyrus]